MQRHIPPEIRRKLTTNALKSLKKTKRLAHKRANRFHLLLAALMQKGSLARNIIKAHEIEISTDNLGFPPDHKDFTLGSSFKKSLKLATKKASLVGQNYIGTEHLFYGASANIISSKKQIPKKYQQAFQPALNLDKLKEIQNHLEEIFEEAEIYDEFNFPLDQLLLLSQQGKQDKLSSLNINSSPSGRPKDPLNKFTKDLIQQAKKDKLDPVIGRKDEINRLIRILTRRQKNNPLLIGEAGVGKTALVEGLAQRIQTGRVPPSLLDKKILKLEISSLIAGTSFRGEFEARLRKIIKKLKQRRDLLFIDELHNIAGTGAASGSLDAANILKSPLTEGEIQIIGATTYQEYREHLADDRALERRFQPLYVTEMKGRKAEQVLKKVKPLYEKHFGVEIPEQLLSKIVYFADKYIPERHLPDKALDLLDEACARENFQEEKIRKTAEYKQLLNKLEAIDYSKTKAVKKDNFDEAISHNKRQKQLKTRLKKAKPASEPEKESTLSRKTVRKTISELKNIPLKEIKSQEQNSLSELKSKLGNEVLGQEEAIQAVCKALQRGSLRLTEDEKPIGSFLFLGPSGVGKTELARVTAQNFFPHQESFTRLDMSEFSEKHTASRLLGAPAGYVGYGKGGQLTEAVRKQPYHLVLFDEIEKAHPKVVNLLLQILEEGSLTDNQGRTVDFKNTVVIMTSNLGSEEFSQTQKKIGFNSSSEAEMNERYEEIKERVLARLRKDLKPELLSRIEKTIVFSPLAKNTVKKITRMQVEELQDSLRENQEIELQLTSAALNHLTENAYSFREGARKVRKVIKEKLETPIVNKILNEKTTPPCKFKARKQNDELKIEEET